MEPEVFVPTIIIDHMAQHCNHVVSSIKIVYSRALFSVAVMSECCKKNLSVKPGMGHWQTVQTQIRRYRIRRLISVCTVCLNYRKFRVRWNCLQPPFSLISQPTLRDNRLTMSVSAFFSLLIILTPHWPARESRRSLTIALDFYIWERVRLAH